MPEKRSLISLQPQNNHIRLKAISLREQATKLLRDHIITGQLRPGTKLVEREVAGLLGISRVPVRESLQELEKEGLVVTRSNARYVIELSEQDVYELSQVRLALEKLAVTLAARNTSPENRTALSAKVQEMQEAFDKKDLHTLIKNDLETHRLIWAQSKNPYLTKTLNSIVCPIFTTFMAIDVEGYRRGLEEVLESHQKVVNSINAGDARLAVQSIERHIVNSLRFHREDVPSLV